MPLIPFSNKYEIIEIKATIILFYAAIQFAQVSVTIMHQG